MLYKFKLKFNTWSDCIQITNKIMFLALVFLILPVLSTQYSVVGLVENNLLVTAESNCTLKQFECSDGSCIPYSWLCDGSPDCANTEDEAPSLCSKNTVCAPTEFKCNSGLCIQKDWICDNQNDCHDHSDEDEENCYKEPCAEDQFSCGTIPKQCIPDSWKCDGKQDCPNGADERNCTQTCALDEFTCSNGNCIKLNLKCNDFNDCFDNSDEVGCPAKTCNPSSEFTCQDGTCISKFWRCDGEFDCLDKSDELGCNKTLRQDLNCNIRPAFCAQDPFCKNQPWICDGNADCPNGVDESPLLCQSNCQSNQFQCADNTCISKFLRCTGTEDCKDGSDEIACKIQALKICDPTTHFDCGNNICVPLEELCSHQNICPNFGDEQQKMCNCDQLNCNQKCVKVQQDSTKSSYRCECEPGYKLINQSTCVDVDECQEITGVCSQNCVNIPGSFTCACQEGYLKNPSDPTKCISMKGPAHLLLATHKQILNISLDLNPAKLVVQQKLEKVVAVDFDFSANLVFWSDLTLRKIFSAKLNDTINSKVVVSDVHANGLAVDWVHRNIYWTDSEKSTIEVANLEGKPTRKTIVSEGLDTPRAIVVDPISSLVFWSDWGNFPKVEKASLDGSNRQQIVVTRIAWPNGLSVDITQKRLYWIDGKLHKIFSSDYEGKSRKMVLHSPIHLKQPYSITTFEDWVYWTDWDKVAIYRANKFTGKVIEQVAPMDSLMYPMDIKMYHENIQPQAENNCESLQCEFICLSTNTEPNDTPKPYCVCSENDTLHQDGRSCEPNNKLIETTTTKVSETSTTTSFDTTTTEINDNDNNEKSNNRDESQKILWICLPVIIILVSFVSYCCYIFVAKLRDKDKVTMSFKPAMDLRKNNRKIGDNNTLLPVRMAADIKANDHDVLEPLRNYNSNDAVV